MTHDEAIKWLESIKQDIGQIRHEDLWHYEQAISEIQELLNEQNELLKQSDERYFNRVMSWFREMIQFHEQNEDNYMTFLHALQLIHDILRTSWRDYFKQSGKNTPGSIVRCKDCKFSKYNHDNTVWCKMNNCRKPDDFFCADGERKEGGEVE